MGDQPLEKSPHKSKKSDTNKQAMANIKLEPSNEPAKVLSASEWPLLLKVIESN